MKVALVADLHIHDWAEFSQTEGVVPSRLHHCTSVLEDVRTYCARHGVAAVILAGDLFHRRGVLYTRPYNDTVTKLARMRSDELPVLAVDGNHDHADKAGRFHSLQALEDAQLIKAVPGCGWVNWHLQDTYGDELVVSGFSYCDSRSLLEERLDAAEKEYRKDYAPAPRIGVFHHGFKGAAVGAALEYVVKEDIDAEPIIDRFDFMFSGHYHRRQFIGTSERAMYIGSPLEHVRGDGGIDKGFIVYDSETKSWELVKLDRPRFVKLTQEVIDSPKDYSKLVMGNYVDVVYEELPMAWPDFERHLRRCGAAGVKPVPVKRERGVTTTRLAVDPSMSAKTILTKYIEHVKPELDRDELLRLGLELLNKVSE